MLAEWIAGDGLLFINICSLIQSATSSSVWMMWCSQFSVFYVWWDWKLRKARSQLGGVLKLYNYYEFVKRLGQIVLRMDQRVPVNLRSVSSTWNENGSKTFLSYFSSKIQNHFVYMPLRHTQNQGSGPSLDRSRKHIARVWENLVH